MIKIKKIWRGGDSFVTLRYEQSPEGVYSRKWSSCRYHVGNNDKLKTSLPLYDCYVDPSVGPITRERNDIHTWNVVRKFIPSWDRSSSKIDSVGHQVKAPGYRSCSHFLKLEWYHVRTQIDSIFKALSKGISNFDLLPLGDRVGEVKRKSF